MNHKNKMFLLTRDNRESDLPHPLRSRVWEDRLLGHRRTAGEKESPDLRVDSPLSCLDPHTEDEREDHDVLLSNREYVNKQNIPSQQMNISPTFESDRQIFWYIVSVNFFFRSEILSKIFCFLSDWTMDWW